jgi:hypothetical protein
MQLSDRIEYADYPCYDGLPTNILKCHVVERFNGVAARNAVLALQPVFLFGMKKRNHRNFTFHIFMRSGSIACGTKTIDGFL